nr:spore germination protein [Bacillus sp. 165]
MSLQDNINLIQQSFISADDFTVRYLVFNNIRYGLLFLNLIVDKQKIESSIIKPLIRIKQGDIQDVIPALSMQTSSTLHQIVIELLNGSSVLLEEGCNLAYILKTELYESKAIEEPVSEKVIRGSHEGLIDNLNINLNLIRRRVKSPHLTIKYQIHGQEAYTKLAMIYVNTIANEELIAEVEKRLSSIKTDYISNSGEVEELIEDEIYSPFAQLLHTERPDRVAYNLLEGRVALIVEGDPSALIMPATFFSFYRSSDDYSNRWYIGSFFRLLRLISFIIAISLPALYIAVVSYHFEVIPIELVFAIKASLEFVPFPPLVEAMAMQLALEMLREASIRLPQPIAQTIGVVGGLVIGTAVVQANFVSNTMIIVVALTAIASFVVPIHEMGTTVRLLGFPLMIAASLFGFVGIVFGLMILLMHLCKLESFGMPYFTPFAPLRIVDLKDTLLRVPFSKMKERPKSLQPKKAKRLFNPRGWDNNETS